MKNKKMKLLSFLNLLVVTLSFVFPTIQSFAATVTDGIVANYSSSWRLNRTTGQLWTDNGVYQKRVDGVTAFCIEHGVDLTPGTGFNPSELTIKEKERLTLIAYYGYQLNPSVLNYAITQALVWQELGDELLTTTIPDYNAHKKRILDKVANHNIKPSFQNKNIELNVNEEITLTDTTGSLQNYSNLMTNSANIKVEKSGNTLKLSANKNSKETGLLKYTIANKDMVGQSFVYHKVGEQKLATFKLANAGEFTLNIKVNHNGNVTVKKIDDDTNLPIPNTKIKFEYNNESKEVITNKEGIASLTDVKAGVKVKITEILAGNGFVNKGEIKEITVEPNKTIDVILNNKAQQGLLHINKTGQIAKSLEITESEYGPINSIIFDYLPLSGVTFDIKAREDIIVGNHVHAKKGTTVATVKTNTDGHLEKMPRLYLGKYEAVEVSTPLGFITNKTPLPFEFNYEGQDIEVVSQSLNVKNNFQTLNITLHKNEENIKDWYENKPVLEEIPANNKIFGLFTNQDFTINDENIVKADSLLEIGTVNEGALKFKTQLFIEGNYYIKELSAGEIHDIDNNKYEFIFKAADNNAEKEISIFAPKDNGEQIDSPLLNKIHLNKFSILKKNEVATLKEKNGFEFDFSGKAEGAVFTLETEKNDIIQEVSADKDSLVNFLNIPVGTFYLKELHPSSDNYLLSDETYKIISDLDGIKAFNSKGKLLNKELDLEENEKENNSNSTNKQITSLFEVENKLIKGTAELSKKDVSTGQILPETGIRVLDKDKHVIIEGRTDQNGKFTFKNLPKGLYYFQEFDAPNGYELDETPIQFEIIEDGSIVKCEMTNTPTPISPLNNNIEQSLPQTGEQKTIKLVILGGLILATSVIFISRNFKRNSKKESDK